MHKRDLLHLCLVEKSLTVICKLHGPLRLIPHIQLQLPRPAGTPPGAPKVVLLRNHY